MSLVRVVAIDAVLVIFFKVLLELVGVNGELALYYSLVIVLVLHVLSSIEFRICTLLRRFNTHRSLLLGIGSKVYMIKLLFRGSTETHVVLNVTGFLVPLLVSIIMLVSRSYMISLEYVFIFVLILLYQLIIFNRLVVVGTYYLGLPLTKVLALTIMLGVVSALILNSPQEAFTIIFVTTYLALLIGMDVLHISDVLTYYPKLIAIGGGGNADALLLLPALSSTITYHASLLILSLTH